MSDSKTPAVSTIIVRILVVIFAGVVLGVWLYKTPPGLLGKADAIGYAVCHQISERSFHIGGNQAPLCARCSGMYMGAFIGLVYQLRLGRRGKLPTRKFIILLGVLSVFFAVDGTNSFLTLLKQTSPLEAIRNLPTLYTPDNWLRLISGLGVGLGISAMLTPIFHQTVWLDWLDEPLLHSWRQIIEIILLSTAGVVAVISENALLIYPIMIISSLTVLIILSMVYTILWTMVLRRENQAKQIRELFIPVILGFTVALLQVAVMDFGRFWLTGTWQGFFS